MSALIVLGLEAVHVGFVLLARKLILCGELSFIVGMVGWNVDARLGLSVWPQRALAQSRKRELVAAAATIVVVLYVAFVRDFAELGEHPSFGRYAIMGLLVMAIVTACAVLWTRGLHDASDLGGVVVVFVLAVLMAVFLDAGVSLSRSLLEPLGQLFRAGPECAHHGMVALLAAICMWAIAVRFIVASRRPRQLQVLDLFLGFALLALAQGFLAYRGVSAIYILAVPAAVAWRAGWRARFEWGKFGMRAQLSFARKSPADTAMASDTSTAAR